MKFCCDMRVGKHNSLEVNRQRKLLSQGLFKKLMSFNWLQANLSRVALSISVCLRQLVGIPVLLTSDDTPSLPSSHWRSRLAMGHLGMQRHGNCIAFFWEPIEFCDECSHLLA